MGEGSASDEVVFDKVGSAADARDVVDGDGRDFPMGDLGNPGLAGLANVGVRAFRNSVYAGGGVMAIAVWLPPSSVLIGLGWTEATGES